MRNYLTEMLTNNGHSEEDIREWLNQSPWITLRLVNNTYEAIRIESGDFKSAYTEYITRNSLEYQTSNDVCIAQYAARMESKVNDPSLLEFSGIKWGATPEEVKAALNLTDAQILRDEAVGDGWDLRIADVTFFGKEVSMGVFSFHRYGSNEFGLNSVNLFYPDETDMTVINDSLAALYGAPKDSMGFTRYQVKQGKITPYTDAGITLVRYEGQKRQLINWWESTAKQADAFPAEVQEAIIASGILSSSGDRVDPADPSSRDVVLEFLAKEPAVFLFCTDSAKVGNPSSGYTKNVVSFDARDYRSQIEYHTKENESGSDTTTAIDPEVDELSTLCIPGIKWGATPEEVKTVLSVTEEQIIGEGKSGNVWRLRVQNITLFGEKIAMGEFSFASFSDSSPYALMSIDLYYLAETDMNAIKDALINIYGAPKDGTGFTRYRIRQGEVEEYVSKGTDLGYYEGASRMISYWESTAKQINVLPADVQEKMATTGMVDVSGLGSGLDAGDPAALGIVQDYLQKEPAVLLYCTDSDEMGKYDAPYSRNRVSFNATNYIAMIQYHRK
jgi:hypothetical protein